MEPTSIKWKMAFQFKSASISTHQLTLQSQIYPSINWQKKGVQVPKNILLLVITHWSLA